VRPRWRSAVGSLRNRPKRWVQNAPRVVQVFCPVAHGAALDGGQVAARVGFGPALAPQVLPGGHAGQDPVLLGSRAELEDGRGEQEDAVLGDALGGAGPVVLLLEDQPLHRRRVPPAVRGGPRHHGEAGVEEGPLPRQVGGEAVAGVTRRQVVGDVGAQPGPALGAERLLGGGEGEVHRVTAPPGGPPGPARPGPGSTPATTRSDRPAARRRSCRAMRPSRRRRGVAR
jgi:hypothetical protein